MTKVVKSCDFPVEVAIKVFEMLNPRVRAFWSPGIDGRTLITDVEPKDLTYPEGWYYAKGNFRNKHTSTTGVYYEIPMKKSDGTYWEEIAKYCTLE